MIEKIKTAIHNNNDLYSAIFASQEIVSNRNESIWYCLEKTPPLYSNLVTLTKDWKPAAIFKQIDAIYKKENWKDWSIKDSFAILDLSKYGFKKLFDAQWIYLESKNFTKTKSSKNLKCKIIRNEKDLANWRIAWDSDEKLGKEIFSNELLNNSKIYFIAEIKEKQIVSGCLVNETENVLGISNFFAPSERVNHWANLIGFIFDSIKFADIVGYERNALAGELTSIGFETSGDLTVWLKNSLTKPSSKK